MRVRCYKNLKTRQWSLYSHGRQKCDLNGAPVDGAHRGFSELALRDVMFEVNASAHARVTRNRLPSGKPYREVHAWAIGEVVTHVPSGPRVAISYHPDRGATFYRRDTGMPVHSAEYMWFDANGEAYAIGRIE